MAWAHAKIAFDEASAADIAALDRIFGTEMAASILDVETGKFRKRLAAAQRAAADAVSADAHGGKGRTDFSVSIYDLDAALLRLIQLVAPYLDPAFRIENTDAARDVIQSGHDLVRAYKIIQKELHEFIESRELIRHIIRIIGDAPEANTIIAALLSDDRFKALARQ
jgi:hypothetical protein